MGKEPEYLTWLVETVQQAVDKPCTIGSPDPAAIINPLDGHMMANIITAEAPGRQ